MVARIKAAANVALGDMTLSCLDTNSCQSAPDEAGNYSYLRVKGQLHHSCRVNYTLTIVSCYCSKLSYFVGVSRG